MQLRPQPNFQIVLGVGIGGMIPADDGTSRFYSISPCPQATPPQRLPVTFGIDEYTLDNAESGLTYTIAIEGDGSGVTRREARKNTTANLYVPCDPAQGKVKFTARGDAGLVSSYSGNDVCFFVWVAGNALPYSFKLKGCTFETDPITGLDVVTSPGALLFGGESGDPPGDNASVLIGASISGANHDEVEFIDGDTVVLPIMLTCEQIGLDVTCSGGQSQDMPTSQCIPSSLNSTQVLNANIRFGARGNIQAGNYFYSDSNCECNPQTSPDCDKALFISSNYTLNDNYYTSCDVNIRFSDGNLTSNISSSPASLRVSNFCDFCDLVLSFNQSGTAQNIISYCGDSFCFKLKPFGSDDWLGFRVVGGIECNGKVDPNNTGMIYYLGKNTLGVDEVGQPLFSVTYENGSFSYSSMLNITQEWRITDSTKVEIELVDSCINDEEPEPEPEPFPEDEPIEELEQDECLSCHVSIDDCCEDDNFTGDIEQFSSIVVPDTYMNGDSGEEERIPWNGLMHVSQILNTGFKTFFAMVYHLSCIWWNNIKTVTNKFVEFFNKFDNWFRYKFDSGEGGIVDFNIPKAIVDEGIEIQESVQCICDKFDSFNSKIDTLNTKIDTLNTNLLTIANNISSSSSGGADLTPVVLAIDSLRMEFRPGSGYNNVGNYIQGIARVLGSQANFGTGGIFGQIKDLNDKFHYSSNDIDKGIAQIIAEKQFEISNPDSLAPVNEIIIESQNYGYVGNGRYTFDDSR